MWLEYNHTGAFRMRKDDCGQWWDTLDNSDGAETLKNITDKINIRKNENIDNPIP